MPEFGVIAGSGIYNIPGLEIIDSVKVISPYGEPSDHYRIGRLSESRPERYIIPCRPF